MKKLIQSENSKAFTVIATICWLGLCPIARAVVPAPDGGYPGGNTAEGQSALLSRTTGGFNTAVGWLSLRSLTTGSFNTGVGAGTLLANTGDENTATGAGALLSNTIGVNNAANGAFALFGNTEGSYNTAVGDRALFSNTTGTVNTAIGAGALANNTTGDDNTALGGDFVLFSNTTGSDNTAIGVDALTSNTGGTENTAIGAFALQNTTGPLNTAVGSHALVNNTTGFANIAVGFDAGSGITTANNVICIGIAGNNVDNSCYIGQIFGSTSVNGVGVLVNSNGRLGTMTSSARFKEHIAPMDKASEALFSLRPITFHYKKDIDPTCTPQLGLVAEEVEKVNPDLVVRDKEGNPYSVRYDQVNAMLLNEFLKEHKKVEKLEATVVNQQKSFESKLAIQEKRMEALASGLQKVSAQLDLQKPDFQTAVANY